jgi:4-hydroxy-tetrahydrodipicolinate synthase
MLINEKKLSVVVISITPFDKKGQLDEKAFRTHLRRLRAAGVSVYVGGAGSGEGYTFTPDELDSVLKISVEELKGKVPFRAMGNEPRTATEMINYMRHVEKAKVDAAQIFSIEIGHGTKPLERELELYYNSIIESTSLPIYLSSHEFAGYVLPISLIERLLDRFPQIVGIAYGGTDTIYLSELLRRVAGRIEVHCAGPANALNVLGLGGNGFMGGEGNFCPELVQSVITAYSTGDVKTFRTNWWKVLTFCGIHTRYGSSQASMRAVKPLMNAFGLPGGFLRAPRLPISQEDLEKMISEVNALEIPEITRI